MEKEMTCIVCPMGCSLIAELENDKVEAVRGNACPRGVQYAKTECVNPQRMVTTTVMCEGGKLLPVKTDRSVKKEDVFKVMEAVNNYTAHLPIKIKDVIIENVCGANIVAVKNMD